jgi:hypothetical protein
VLNFSRGERLPRDQFLHRVRNHPHRPNLPGTPRHQPHLVAAATIHRIDYLLTRNQKHLANSNKRTHFAVVCARLNLPAPQIVTPDLLIVENDDA